MSGGHIYTVYTDESHEGQRIDAVLAELIEESSRSYLQKLIAEGCVAVDGQTQRSKKEKLKGGQRLDVAFPPPAQTLVLPQKIDLEIVYEDEDLIVVNKQKGLVVHPAEGNPDGTLVNALLYHTTSLSTVNGAMRPGIVHRIDKDTSGLLVVAKTDAAHRGLAAQLFDRTVERRYRAIVWHGFPEEEGTVDAPIGRDPKNRLKRAVVEGGKPAVTHYRVLERLSSFTSILATLETGRTHQIRVHMAHIRHPVLGDALYGPRRQPFGLSGQALHAGVLGFTHPIREVPMRFEVDPPQAYEDILKKLKNRM